MTTAEAKSQKRSGCARLFMQGFVIRVVQEFCDDQSLLRLLQTCKGANTLVDWSALMSTSPLVAKFMRKRSAMNVKFPPPGFASPQAFWCALVGTAETDRSAQRADIACPNISFKFAEIARRAMFHRIMGSDFLDRDDDEHNSRFLVTNCVFCETRIARKVRWSEWPICFPCFEPEAGNLVTMHSVRYFCPAQVAGRSPALAPPTPGVWCRLDLEWLGRDVMANRPHAVFAIWDAEPRAFRLKPVGECAERLTAASNHLEKLRELGVDVERDFRSSRANHFIRSIAAGEIGDTDTENLYLASLDTQERRSWLQNQDGMSNAQPADLKPLLAGQTQPRFSSVRDCAKTAPARRAELIRGLQEVCSPSADIEQILSASSLAQQWMRIHASEYDQITRAVSAALHWGANQNAAWRATSGISCRDLARAVVEQALAKNVGEDHPSHMAMNGPVEEVLVSASELGPDEVAARRILDTFGSRLTDAARRSPAHLIVAGNAGRQAAALQRQARGSQHPFVAVAFTVLHGEELAFFEAYTSWTVMEESGIFVPSGLACARALLRKLRRGFARLDKIKAQWVLARLREVGSAAALAKSLQIPLGCPVPQITRDCTKTYFGHVDTIFKAC